MKKRVTFYVGKNVTYERNSKRILKYRSCFISVNKYIDSIINSEKTHIGAIIFPRIMEINRQVLSVPKG